MNRLLLIVVAAVAVLVCLWNVLNIHAAVFSHCEEKTSSIKDVSLELSALKAELQQEKNRTKALESHLQYQTVEKQRLELQLKALHTSGVNYTFSNKTLPNHGICSLLPSPVPSTMALWSFMLGDIISATRHERDQGKFVLHDFYAQILHIMTPDRLQRSIKSIPHDWATVQGVMDVGYKRWLYLQNKQGPEPPRIKIVVMGGSVMVGVQCRNLPFSYRMPRKECTWTYRLQRFLNKLLGGDIVETHNIAMGGTNSETGHMLWDYELLPDEARNPDILINAYSTNDMHVLTALDAERSGQTLGDKVMDIVQEFVRSVMRPCKNKKEQPIYIHMDDYLGNEQPGILDTFALSQSVHVLASYYGFAFISYADVLRDLVYGDTHEMWFSPKGWYNEIGEFEREIHPGMAMHILSTWLVSYNLLNLVTSYCSTPWTIQQRNLKTSEEVEYEALHGLPQLIHGGRWVPQGKPKRRPKGLPPRLTKALLLSQVSDMWRNSSVSLVESDCSASSTTKRCVFSWISGLTPKMSNEETSRETWSSYLIENNGWGFANDYNKLGFVPEGLNSNFTMEFSNLTQPIRLLTVMILKSYGEKWVNSQIQVNASVRREDEWIDVKSYDFVGHHNKNTSETYTHEIPFEGDIIVTGSSLRVGFELVGGTTFKIMGLAVCS